MLSHIKSGAVAYRQESVHVFTYWIDNPNSPSPIREPGRSTQTIMLLGPSLTPGESAGDGCVLFTTNLTRVLTVRSYR